jgi:hypothetical protein
MTAEAAQMLSDWHDFYILIGTASATLIGLMFVSASIAAGFVTDQHRAGLQAFLTPTVVHFSAILATCLLLLAPLGARPLLAILLMAMGLASFVYAAMVWLRMRREGLFARIDNADRVWYGLGPVAFYLVLVAGAATMLAHPRLGLEIAAAAQAALLLFGIRNAWDITIWWLTRRSGDQ